MGGKIVTFPTTITIFDNCDSSLEPKSDPLTNKVIPYDGTTAIASAETDFFVNILPTYCPIEICELKAVGCQ